MANAREKAKELRDQIKQMQEPSETDATAVTASAEASEIPVAESAQPDDQASNTAESVQLSEGANAPDAHPAPQHEPDIDYRNLYNEELTRRQKVEKNYDNLRSWASRVKNENMDYKRRLELLVSQETADDNDIDPEGEEGEEEPAAPDAQSIATLEQAAAQLEQRPGESVEQHSKRLNELFEDWPELRDYHETLMRMMDSRSARALQQMEEKLQGFEGRIKPVVDTVQAQVTEQTQREAEARRTAAEKAYTEYLSKIAAAHPDYEQVAQSDAFGQWLNGHPLGNIYQGLLWPQDGQSGGSSAQVIRIFNEYKREHADNAPRPADYADAAVAASQVREQQAAQARAQAERDAEPMPKAPARPAVVGESPAISREELARWAKDPRLWKQHQAEIRAAQKLGGLI